MTSSTQKKLYEVKNRSIYDHISKYQGDHSHTHTNYRASRVPEGIAPSRCIVKSECGA